MRTMIKTEHFLDQSGREERNFTLGVGEALLKLIISPLNVFLLCNPLETGLRRELMVLIKVGLILEFGFNISLLI